MIESMTGFGRGTARSEGISVTIEIRSVNSRFCEVSARLPSALAAFETEVQNVVRRELSRGKINVNVQVSYADEESLPLQVNVEAARAYGALMRSLKDAAGAEGPIGLDHILKFSDVFLVAEPSTAATELAWEVTHRALTDAIGQLKDMRRKEGEALQKDLEERIDTVEQTTEEIRTRAPGRVEQARRRLGERVAQLIGDTRFDSERLELEIALFADRADVTEECIRMQSHIELFRNALTGIEPAGRKLNFLLQEMNREANTIGSKANDAGISHHAVSIKEELERIREQVQNIE